MESDLENEPTCVVKVLRDFRSDNIPGRRLSAFGFPSFGQRENLIIGKPTKLIFDDTIDENETSFGKKRKIEDTPESLKFNDSLSSPWESRKLKIDLAEAKSEIARLESRMCQMETVHKETMILFEQEKKSLQQSLDKERNSALEIEQRWRSLRKQKADTKQDLIDLQAKYLQDKLKWEELHQNLIKENMELKEKFNELDSDSGSKVTKLERQLSAAEVQFKDLQQELQSTKEVLNQVREELNDKRAEARLWDSEKTKLTLLKQKVEEYEYERESNQKAIAAAQTQQSKLLRLYDLEKEFTALKEENVNLRQAVSNKLYLEGLVADMKKRLSVLQERENEIVSLKVELGITQTKLKEWAEMSTSILGKAAGSPIFLRQTFEKVQKNEVVLTSEISQLKSRLKKMEALHNDSQNEAQQLKIKINNLKQNIEQNNIMINRLRKRNNLIIWERNDLRQLVDSCQKEFNMTTSAALDTQQLSKLEALEKALEGYIKRNQELENELSLGLGGTGLGGGGLSNFDSIEYVKLKTENENLIKEKETLLKKIQEFDELLEYRALKGDYDTRNTKVIHLRANPLSEATSKHENDVVKYQTEIAKLRERVKLLQEGKMHDLTQVVDQQINSDVVKEVEDLRKKLTSQERQNQKLTEAFELTTKEFLEAVYRLFGYKVDSRLSSKIYRLTSLYAESPDHQLKFKVNAEGGMDLIETQFSSTLGDLIEIHLQQENSIPVFLSALTMQLFQKQTFCSLSHDNTAILISD